MSREMAELAEPAAGMEREGREGVMSPRYVDKIVDKSIDL